MNIKFRAYPIEHVREFPASRHILPMYFLEFPEKNTGAYWFDIFNGKKRKVESFIQDLSGYILMQFTGIKDKNGEDIYEGDIFQDEEDGYCDFVEWDNEHCGWTTHQWFLPSEFKKLQEMEVIGNIYENPELLKQ